MCLYKLQLVEEWTLQVFIFFPQQTAYQKSLWMNVACLYFCFQDIFAQYCTYTTMENDSKDIVHVVTIDKRETQRNSVIMEKDDFYSDC